MTRGLQSLTSLLLAAPLALAAGCSVHVDKHADGRDKDVKVDTPLGGVHVNTSDASAKDVGIVAYPGATIDADHEGDKAADVQLGFGPWQMRVKVVNYATNDNQEKVVQFYRKSLGSDAIECRGNRPVGTPTHTREGLTCSDDEGGHHVDTSGDDLLLKSGSHRKQRLVAIKHAGDVSASGPTRFALIALNLPSTSDKDRESD